MKQEAAETREKLAELTLTVDHTVLELGKQAVQILGLQKPKAR